MNLARWLRQRAEASPGAPALLDDGVALDFAALEARVAAASACLAGSGVGPGDAVALLAPNAVELVVAIHAVARCGARVVPLNTRLTPGELAPQLRVARPVLLLHAEALAATARAAAAAADVPTRALAPRGCPACGGAPEHAGRGPAEPGARASDDLAVLFTSGTTGRPKGVRLRHANLAWSAHASALRLGDRAGDRWLACLPLFHVGGLSLLVRSVLQGSAVRLTRRFDPERLAAILDADAATLLPVVPTMLARLLEARGRRAAPEGLRAVLLGGAAASPALLERARARGYPVLPSYGLTESASQVATASPQAPPAPASWTGPPLFGTAIRIVDAGGRPVPAGVEGEIELRGPTLTPGYLEDPAASAAAFRAGWLRTGDLGSLGADGALRVLDRREDRVVSGGENVHPAEVEAVLLDHPAVAEAGVTGLPDADLGARVVAWVVPRAGAGADEAALRGFCRARLAGYKVPKQVHVVTALPRTASGKLQRARLPALQPPEDEVWNSESLSRQPARSALASGRVKPSSSATE